MAQEQALNIDQGSDYEQPFKFFSDSNNTDILDLNGASARMSFRQDDYDGKVLLLLTNAADGGLVIDAAAGTIKVVIPAARTAALKAAKGTDSITGRYDLEMEAGGKTKRLLQGDFTITREVTTSA